MDDDDEFFTVDLTLALCPWEGALVYHRDATIHHLEYATSLERLGLRDLSSPTLTPAPPPWASSPQPPRLARPIPQSSSLSTSLGTAAGCAWTASCAQSRVYYIFKMYCII
jgi:hypothetical protein